MKMRKVGLLSLILKEFRKYIKTLLISSKTEKQALNIIAVITKFSYLNALNMNVSWSISE